MTYKATLKVSFDTEFVNYTSYSVYDEETLPEEHYTFEIPAQELNTVQLFRFFGIVARTMGHNDVGIMKGACSLAFNDMRSVEDMRRVADEYDLKMVEDYRTEVCKLEEEVLDLKAKLSRYQQPDNPDYTDEEMEAMTAEVLRNANVVCHDCGKKYGTYSVGCSSTWEGKCEVCGKTKGVTEVRDYGYLKKGIGEINEEDNLN